MKWTNAIAILGLFGIGTVVGEAPRAAAVVPAEL
jgi:hypothetical protein